MHEAKWELFAAAGYARPAHCQCVDADRTARTACTKSVERAHIVAPVSGWVSLKVLTFVAEIADDAHSQQSGGGDGGPENRLSADALRRKEAGDKAFR